MIWKRLTASPALAAPVAAVAVVTSLAVTAAVACITGLLGLWFEAEHLLDQDHVSVVDCVIGPEETSLLSLSWLRRATRAIEPPRLCRHNLERQAAIDNERKATSRYAGCLAACALDDTVLVGEQDGSIRLLRLREPAGDAKWVSRHLGGEIHVLERSADGARFLSASPAETCGWHLATGACLWRRGDLCVSSAAYQPGSDRIVCGLVDGRLIEIDAGTGYTTREFGSFPHPVLAVRFDPLGRRLACVAADGQTLMLEWPAASMTWSDPLPGPYACGFRALCFSPCGRWLVTAAKDQVSSLVVWDVESGQRVGKLRGHTAAVLGARFGPRGTLFSWSADGTIRRWDVDRHVELGVIGISSRSRLVGGGAT